MDEGIWLTVNQVVAYIEKENLSGVWFRDCFEWEDDAGKMRIYKVRRQTQATANFLSHFGYGFQDIEPPKRIRPQLTIFHNSECDVCKSKVRLIAVSEAKIRICPTCLGELLAFYEMAEEKGDSGTKETTDFNWKQGLGWNLTSDKGFIRKEGV